ncbi:hypothetical protein Lal_00024162 [Lupinus albus]|nr:hypothetical protein Lal_00024162 [Lupinus albus]
MKERGRERVRGREHVRRASSTSRGLAKRKGGSSFSGTHSSKPFFQNSMSFFLTNFPTDFGAKEMWEIFNKWGKCVDVVIPSRKDKYGKKFGFARFLNVQDIKSMVEKLDRIRIGSYKIWVYIPKFDRGQGSKQVQSSHFTRTQPATSSGHQGGCQPLTSLRDGQSHQKPVLEYQTAEASPTWLSNSYIGIAANYVDCDVLSGRLHMNGFSSINPTHLGGQMFLLRAEEDGELEDFIKEEHDWFQNQFEVLRKWETSDVPTERFSWIRCYGIPLHPWEEKLFNKLSLHNLSQSFAT